MENKLTRWFVNKWGKPLVRQKPHWVILTTPKNPLINNQAVTSIKNLTNYLCLSQNTNLQLNLRFNTQFKTWSCSSLLSFDAQISNLWLTLCTNPSTWLTLTTLNNVVGCKVLHFINNDDQEALGYKTLWWTSAVASHRKNKSLGLCIHVWRLLK